MKDESKFSSLQEYRATIALSDKDLNELDELTLQNQEAALNTFYRCPRVEPEIIKANPEKDRFHPEVRTLDGILTLSKIDEITLYILCEFKFIPLWLINNWYFAYGQYGYDNVLRWIQFGLVWCEPTSLGVYIRPTMFLLNVIYDKDDGNKKFIGLPFNLMNHTCSEEDIMFNIMMGNEKDEFWNMFINSTSNKLPCYHPLFVNGFDPSDTTGSTILAESLFRKYDPSDILAGHRDIELEMQAKETITKEFSDWSLFTLECGYDGKGKLETQRPDLVIPVPRDKGMPRSYAIEMELTAKDTKRYDKIMEHYKNNNIYGGVIYLCSKANPNIAELIRKSYENVGGLGTCKLYMMPYNPPAQMLSTFDSDHLDAQYGLLKATINKTNEIKSTEINNG